MRSRARTISHVGARASATALVCLLNVVSPAVSQGFDVTWIPEAVTCRACTIELTEHARLGREEGEGAIEFLGGHSFSAIDSEGRIYLRGHFSTEVKVYEKDGEFRQTIGREGEGPGEFRGVMGIVVGLGDSLFVLDRFNMRLSVFDPGHRFARSAPLEVLPQGVDPVAVPWNPGFFFVTSHMRTAALIGWPVHEIDAQGHIVRSFGSATGEFSPSEPYSEMRVVADAGEGNLWVGRLAHYWIQLQSPGTREPLEDLRREPTWFPKPSLDELRAGDHGAGRPPPMLADILEDDGLLWVLTWPTDPDWSEAGPDLEDEHLRYDSMIEVIDLETKRVVVRRRFEELYDHFLGPGLIGGPYLDGGYIPVFRVMNMAITGR